MKTAKTYSTANPVSCEIPFDPDKASFEYREGVLVMRIEGQGCEPCPVSLPDDVIVWCRKTGVNPDILADAMAEAADKELRMSLIRSAMM